MYIYIYIHIHIQRALCEVYIRKKTEEEEEEGAFVSSLCVSYIDCIHNLVFVTRKTSLNFGEVLGPKEGRKDTRSAAFVQSREGEDAKAHHLWNPCSPRRESERKRWADDELCRV